MYWSMGMVLLSKSVILVLPELLSNFKFQRNIKSQVMMIAKKINSFLRPEGQRSKLSKNQLNNSLLKKKRKKVLFDPTPKK